MSKAGAVWIDVLPNLAGWNTAVRAQSRVALEGSGAMAGKSYTAGMLRSLKVGLGGMSAEVGAAARGAAASAAAAVEQASVKVTAARGKEEAAAGRVRVAELKLQELRVKDNASASSLAAAEERLALAKRGLTTATEGVVGAERAERVAHERSTAAARTASGASVAAGGRFTAMGGQVERSAGRMTSRVGGFAKAVGGMAGIFGAFEVAKFAGESIKAATEYQKTTSILVTAAGESTKNLALIRKQLVNISDETGTTTDQLSEGMYTIEKAGFRGAHGLKILDAAAKGAKEENADLGVVTNAMTSIMNSYGIKAGKSVNVMNALKTAAAQSKTTMQNFAGSLSTVLPIAAANHISFADIAGDLGTLTSHGTSAQEATQELAFSIRSLSAPNAVAIKEMGQFGISSQSVATHLGKKGLQGTIEQLSTAVLKRMGPSGKVLLNTFYQSSSAAKSAQQIYDKLTPAQKKLADEFKNGSESMKDWTKDARGSLAPEQFNQISQWATLQKKTTGFNDAIKQGLPGSQTYSEAMKKMMGGSTGLNTALMLTGTSAEATKKRTDAVSKSYKDNAKEVEGWKATQQTAAVAQDRMKNSVKNAGMVMATAFLPSLTKMTTGLANGVTWVMKFAQTHKWVGQVAKYVAIAAGAFIGLAVAVWAVNAAIAVLTSPITAVIVAVAALAIGFTLAYKRVSWFHTAVDATWRGIKVATQAVVTWFSTVAWPALVGGFHKAGAAASWLWHNAIQPAWTGIRKATAIWWAGVKLYFTLMYDFVTKWIWPVIKFMWHYVWEPAFKAMGKIISLWWNYFVKPAFHALWWMIKNVVGPVVSWLWKNIVKPVFGWIGAHIVSMWNNHAKPALLAFQRFIHNGIGPAITWLWKNVAEPMFKNIGQGGYTMWHKVLSPMFSTFKSTIKNLKRVFSDTVSGISKAWGKLESAAKAPVKFVVNSVVRPFVGAFDAIGDKFGVHIPKPAKMYAGGYTGQGAKYASRGIIEVHGNEYVQPSEVVSREGVGAMRALHSGQAHIAPNSGVPGFASGGHVSDGLSKIIRTVGYALRQVGKPYVWGAAGPNAFDCSGLTSAAWAHGAGLSIPHLAKAQHDRVGFPVSRSNLFPGDLVFPRMTAGGGIPHVEMYVGKGNVVEAMNPHLGIRGPHPMNGFAGGARRPELFATANAKNSGSIWSSLGNLIAAAARKGGSFLGSIGGMLFNPIKNMVSKPLGKLAAKFPYPFATKVLPGAVKSLASGAFNWGKHKLESAFSFLGGGGGGGSTPKGLTGSPKGMVPEIADSFGVGSQVPAIDYIFRRESNFNPFAKNPLSGAYGIPQALPGSKMAAAGKDWLSNPATQEAWGIKYMIDRYGSPNAAMAFWKRHHYYLNGTSSAAAGPAWLSEDGRPELVVGRQQRMMRQGDRVFNAAQTERMLGGGSLDEAAMARAMRKGMNGARLALEVGGKRVLADVVVDELESRVGAGVLGGVG